MSCRTPSNSHLKLSESVDGDSEDCAVNGQPGATQGQFARTAKAERNFWNALSRVIA